MTSRGVARVFEGLSIQSQRLDSERRGENNRRFWGSPPRMAPSARLDSGCSTTRLHQNCVTPKGPHNAQAPAGLLKKEQARLQFVDRVAPTPGGVACRKKYFPAFAFHRRDGGNTGELSAVSKDSARRSLVPLTLNRSTTHRWGLAFFFERGDVVKVHHAVDADTNKNPRRDRSKIADVPFLGAPTGARRSVCAPVAPTASTIWERFEP
ncbi:MAG: hypothetical protein CM15mP74_17820 [Halieaceae bacterium]|nr:MAG: hypothetical protein CM15mP74_17820 [Halieaceae bacterium]